MYNALESEHAAVSIGGTFLEVVVDGNKVQERALKVVPDLCDTIDYAEVQGVLFPRVAVSPRSQSSSADAELIASVPFSAGIYKDKNPVGQGHDPADVPQHGQNPGPGSWPVNGGKLFGEMTDKTFP